MGNFFSLPNFFSGADFFRTDGTPDVAESRMKCVRVSRVRRERVAKFVRQGGAVDVGRSAVFWNVQNRADALIWARTRNGII